MAEEAGGKGGYQISERLLRLSTPRKPAEAPAAGSGDSMNGGSPVGSRPGSPSKKLSKEEVEASANRLAQSHRKEVQLKPLVISRKLTAEETQHSVQRLYKDSIEVSKKKREISAQRAHRGDHSDPKKIDDGQLSEMVVRLHDRSAEQKQKKMEALIKKVDSATRGGDSRPATGVGRKLSASEQNAVAMRLHDESPSKARDNKAKLFEKYVLSKVPKAAAMNDDEIAQASARLYKNERRQ